MSQRFHNGINCTAKSSTGAPTTGTWAVGDLVCDSAGEYWRCTAAGAPGTWTGVGGSLTLATDREVSASKPPASSDSRLRTPFALNYITNPDAEIDTTGWSTYADAAGTQPVDGTGGSPTTTWTRTTGVPLSGVGSFLLTKDAANRQGEGAGFAFTIDLKDTSKSLTLAGSVYYTTGTYTAGEVSLWVYDVTNSRLCPISGGNAVQADGSFAIQFSSSLSTSYRLIVHIGGTSASAYSLRFDAFYVGPMYLPGMPAMSDDTAYTPTFTGIGTPTSVRAMWRRVGDTLHVWGTCITGTVAASAFSISLPSGLTIDSTKQPVMGLRGALVRDLGSTSNTLGVIGNGGNTSVGASLMNNSGFAPLSPMNGNNAFNASERISFWFTVPIQGWGGTTAVQPGSRYLWAQRFAANATRVTTTPSKPGEYRARRLGTDTAPTNAPSAADGFRIESGSGIAAGRINQYDIYVGPGKVVQLIGHQSVGRSGILTLDHWYGGSHAGAIASLDSANGVFTVLCYIGGAGDQVGTIQDGTTVTSGYFDLLVADDPVPVALAPAVHVEASSDAGQAVTANTTDLQYEDEASDTHGAWNGSVFTAPVAGTYVILAVASTTGTGQGSLAVYKAGSQVVVGQQAGAAAGQRRTIAATLKLAAGDTVSVRSTVSETREATSTLNRLSITRIGDA